MHLVGIKDDHNTELNQVIILKIEHEIEVKLIVDIDNLKSDWKESSGWSPPI